MNPASPGVEERHVFGDPVVFGAVVGVGGEFEAAGGLAAHGPVHGVVEGALHAGHLERRRTSVSMRVVTWLYGSQNLIHDAVLADGDPCPAGVGHAGVVQILGFQLAV